MAYAGSIIIETKLDTKEFEKSIKTINNQLSKINVNKLKDMRKEINLCQTGLKKMSENLATFNSVRLNTNKFKSIALQTQNASKYTASLNRTIQNMSNNINNINSDKVKDVATSFKNISNTKFKNISTLNGLGSNDGYKKLNIPYNIKDSITISNQEISGLTQNIQSALSFDFTQAYNQRIKQMLINTSAIVAGIIKSFTSLSIKIISIFKNFTSKTLTTFKNWGKQINSNIKSIISSFKSMMYAIGIDLSFTGFVRGIKNAIQEMQSLQSTVLGFNTMIQVQGIDLKEATKYVEEYASDGLVSLQGAMTQFKNYALRGYDLTEIEQLMNIAKDFAIVNKKSDVDLETALLNLSEGIKLDMSRLMDASGLSKNLSNIYSDYANKIGKGVSSLTNEEEMQAILEYFKEMNKYSEGNAKRISSTFVGTISRLTTQTKYLFAELGNTVAFVLKPILESIIVVFSKWEEKIKNVNDSINKMIENINNKILKLFGVSKEEIDKLMNSNTKLEGITDLRNEQQAITKVTDDATESLEEEAEAVKKVLAPFDTLNKVSFNNTSTTTDDIESNIIDTGSSDIIEEEAETTVYWLDYLKLAFDKFIDSLDLDFEPLKKSWKNLTDTLFGKDVGFTEGISNSLGDGFVYVKDNIIGPFIKWFTEEGLPVLIEAGEIIVDSFKNANIDFTPLKTSLSGLWDVLWGEDGENFKATVSFLFNDIIVPLFQWLIEWALPNAIKLTSVIIKFVQEYGPYLIEIIKFIWSILEPILTFILNLVISIFNWFNNLSDPVQKVLSVGIVLMTAFVAGLLLIINALMAILPLINSILKIKVGKTFVDILAEGLVKFVPWLSKTALPAIGKAITGFFSGIGTWFTGTALPWVTKTALPAIGKAITGFFSSIGSWITGTAWPWLINTALPAVGSKIMAFLTGLGGTILAAIATFFVSMKIGEWVAQKLNEVGILTDQNLKDLYWTIETWIDAVKTFFYNLVLDIKEGFESIPDKVKGVFEDIKNWFKNFDLFEFLKDKIDDVGNWMSDLWNKLTGKDSNTSKSNPLDGYYNNTSPYYRATYKVPAYANGVVLPANNPHLAIVGDQKQGTSIETQISTMMEAMQRVLAQNNANGQVIQNVLELDGQVVYKANNKVSRQRGNRMINR